MTPVPTACQNTSLPACCAVRAPRWRPLGDAALRPRTPKSCSKAISHADAAHPSGWQRARSKGRTARAPATCNECAIPGCFTVDPHHAAFRDAIYHSTYTGKPPDEPAVLGVALNSCSFPLLQRQFPEIIDFYLPPEGCSYHCMALVRTSRNPGHARRVMMGVEPSAPVHVYTKFIVVVDDDVDVRDWKEVVWALTTHGPGARHHDGGAHPIDYLDFASPVSGLGSKMGLDATNKSQARRSANGAAPSPWMREVTARMDALYTSPQPLTSHWKHLPAGKTTTALRGTAHSRHEDR